MKGLVLAALRGYQLCARAVLPPACRFWPSCSDYAAQAVAERGWAGAWLAVWRLLRCHPGDPGGWDPVPNLKR